MEKPSHPEGADKKLSRRDLLTYGLFGVLLAVTASDVINEWVEKNTPKNVEPYSSPDEIKSKLTQIDTMLEGVPIAADVDTILQNHGFSLEEGATLREATQQLIHNYHAQKVLLELLLTEISDTERSMHLRNLRKLEREQVSLVDRFLKAQDEITAKIKEKHLSGKP